MCDLRAENERLRILLKDCASLLDGDTSDSFWARLEAELGPGCGLDVKPDGGDAEC